jgi:hemolysin activation/secretion protein
MFAAACRVIAALAMVAVPFAAAAQVIPPSEQPGRQRERFIQPETPQAQPGGTAISLPSTVAPAGAENISLFITGIQIVGSIVYSADELASLYQGLVGHEWSLKSIYDLAQRITAKYGSDGYVLSRAVVPPQQLNPKGAVVRIEVVEGCIDKVEWPAQLSRYRDFFSYHAARITARRPVNIRTIERYLLPAVRQVAYRSLTSRHRTSDQELPFFKSAHIEQRGSAQ